MSSTTPTIGLKKPEGSDPFLTEDFASNLDKIDQAFAARPVGGGGGSGGSGGDAATLQGHPASFFYSSEHPPPTGAGGSTTDAATLQGHPASYFAVAGAVDAATLGGHPASYFYSPDHPDPSAGGGGSYTLPGSVVQSPGRTNPKIVFSTTSVTFGGVNGVNGINMDYSGAGFAAVPTVLLTAEVGSNFDMITNVQGRSTAGASARMARVTGANTSTTATLHWMAVGV